jgi:hypothetical protein
MTNKEAIAFEPEEVEELERIVLDRDRDAAFEFLRRVVWAKVDGARQRRLNPRQFLGGSV